MRRSRNKVHFAPDSDCFLPASLVDRLIRSHPPPPLYPPLVTSLSVSRSADQSIVLSVRP